MRYCLFFLFMLAISPCIGQLNSFDGVTMTEDRKTIPYHFEMYFDSFNHITGYTYKNNDTAHKFYVEGYYTDTSELVFFKEYSSDDRCPIFFNGLIKNLIDNIYTMAGVYQSRDGKCMNGYINLITQNFVSNHIKKNLKNSIPKDIDEESMAIIHRKILKENVAKDIDYKMVKSNSKTKIKWESDMIQIKIYDNAAIDGDKVRLIFNDKIISDNLVLSKAGFVFKVPVRNGVNTLKITALNEGTYPTNTSKIEIFDTHQSHFFLNYLEEKKSLEYIIEK